MDIRNTIRKLSALARRWMWSGFGPTGLLGLWQTFRGWFPSIWRKVADLDTIHSLLQMGGFELPSLVTIVASPFFGVVLIIAGLIGIPAATRASEGKLADHVWTVAGWTTFIVAVSSLFSVLLFGQFATNSRVIEAGIFYVEQHTERHLNDAEIRMIVDTFSPIKDQFLDLRIASIDTSEATGYAVDFISAFRMAGYTVNNRKPDDLDPPLPEPGRLVSSKMRGVFVGVKIRVPVSDTIKMFAAKLAEAGFTPQYS